MMQDYGKKGRSNKPAGSRFHLTEHGIGLKAALVTELKFSAQNARKLNTVCEPRLARNPKIIIDSDASKHVVSDVSLFKILA